MDVACTPSSPARRNSRHEYGELLDSPARQRLLIQRMEDVEITPVSPAESLVGNAAAADAHQDTPARQRARAIQAALARAGGGAATQALAGLLNMSSGDENAALQLNAKQAESHSAAPCVTPAPMPISLRELLFDPARFFSADVVVTGTIVVLDLDMDRMDLSCDGAKLIVHIGKVDRQSSTALLPGPTQLGCGSVVSVVGRPCKQQRRTFLEAHALHGQDEAFSPS